MTASCWRYTAAASEDAGSVRRVWFFVRYVKNRLKRLDCQARRLYETTGYDEISLSSLSISDYSSLEMLTDALLSWTDAQKVSLSLPSLRAVSFSKAANGQSVDSPNQYPDVCT